eukprot:CAMPEP_0194399452 /NCGR_PEP_ID=MMETSP0174-20130528/126669_1 /TAXON_ID=216777 /ORGANISM="Proboscia alata, Strain PI-D3" /LENGTH=474 /DNA_ID=CAMNT_0039195865 /DNA_START=83 /DNA_END=1504 /DNA_ORIENTATION=-
MHRRVVVTGMGAITPLGNTFQTSWKRLFAPTSTSPSTSTSNQQSDYIVSLEEAMRHQVYPNYTYDANSNEYPPHHELWSRLPCQVAAAVQNPLIPYDPRTSRFVQLALAAGIEAVEHAGLTSTFERNTTTSSSEPTTIAGTAIGVGMSGVYNISMAHQDLLNKKRLSPHFVPRVLPNSASSRLSLHYHLTGPNLTPSTACAAGAHAIGDAARCVMMGDADIMLAGGADSCLDSVSLAGFCGLRALSTTFNDTPIVSSRPFDTRRDGFVMGEGACVLILEEYEHARDRGAHILAEVGGVGYTSDGYHITAPGYTSDGYHITAPHPEGKGAEGAMRTAVRRAGLELGDVEYVNAHATSTPLGDAIESKVIERTLMTNAEASGRTQELYVSSTKGATGHLLGASGALEAAFTIQSLVENRIPPTANLEEWDDTTFRHVRPNTDDTNVFQREGRELKVALSNSFGFGGTNVSLVFTKG